MNHAWRTGTVESSGEAIYYEVAGNADAPTVVLTHGAGGSHAVWYQQVPVLADAGYRVVAWDSRGFGLSSFATGRLGTAEAAGDLARVLDAVSADRVHVVGQSMGGWWATAFAISQRDRLQSLALSNTVGGLWTDALMQHFATFVASTSPDNAVLGVHSALSPSFAEREPARAFLYQELNTFHSPPLREVGKALAGAHVAHADIDALDVPVLVITGSDDALFPAALVADSARLLANAEIVEIADAGHSPYFERPDEYNAALLRHFDRAR